MNAFANHFTFEFRTGIRNKHLLLMNYLFPLGFYLMMGAIMPGINPPFREDLIPAMVVFAVMAATFLGIPDPLVNAREKGIFRSYKINGIPALSLLLIPALTTALHLTILAAIITFTAPVLFDAPFPTDWVAYLLAFLAFTMTCTGMSILIGVASPTSRMTVLWSQVVFVPSMMLGGLMVPYSMLPDTAGKFAQLLPATHAMNALKSLAMGKVADFTPWGSLIVLALSGLVAFALALYLFSWDSKNTVRRGHPLLTLLTLLPFAVGMLIF